ncbi:hypothetical protein C8Q74DRAFT_1372088 [Fomes fomentarius]|nr:hypothetical protein C8Q74DRAFT_1372088 [Fomes fomentarius]
MFDADRLDVLEVRFPPQSGLEPLHVPTPRTLTCQSLRLQPLQDPAGYSLTLEAFRQTLSPESLQKLSVGCWDWEHVRGIGALLRDCCSHLEHLRMDAFPMALADETHGRGNDGWNVVDLSACPRLLSLDFVIPFGTYHAASTGHFACTALAALLSRASPVLSTVSMQLVRVGEAQPSDLAADLWAVSRVLTTRRFTQLQAVNMFIPEWEDMEAFRSAVESVLPTLMEEGLLKLQSRHDYPEE